MFLFSPMKAGLDAEATDGTVIEMKRDLGPLGDDPLSPPARTLRHPGTRAQCQPGIDPKPLGTELLFMVNGGRGERLSVKLHSHSYFSSLLCPCRYMCGFTKVIEHIWRPKDNLQELVLSFLYWVPKMELGSSDLTASIFTHRVISLVSLPLRREAL